MFDFVRVDINEYLDFVEFNENPLRSETVGSKWKIYQWVSRDTNEVYAFEKDCRYYIKKES